MSILLIIAGPETVSRGPRGWRRCWSASGAGGRSDVRTERGSQIPLRGILSSAHEFQVRYSFTDHRSVCMGGFSPNRSRYRQLLSRDIMHFKSTQYIKGFVKSTGIHTRCHTHLERELIEQYRSGTNSKS
jgi:hypothetical protein